MSKKNKSSLHVKIVIITFIIILFIGTITFRYLENWSFIESFYFSVSTMTTVGYGDLYPTTDLSKMFLSIYALISVTLYISTAVILGDWYIEKTIKKHIKRNKKTSK